jgi:hypothetical protein
MATAIPNPVDANPWMSVAKALVPTCITPNHIEKLRMSVRYTPI